MKKQVLFISSFLMLGATLNAQTWSSTDEPGVSATTLMYVVDSNAVNYSGSTGADQTFDYSQTAGYIGNNKLVTIADPALSIFSTYFPSSSHNLMIPGYIEKFYTFDVNSKQGQGIVITIDGIGDGVLELSTNNQQVLEFPVSLGVGFSDDFEGTFTMGGSTFPASGSTMVLADATGTLMLANDVTYTGVLRVKTIDTTYTEVDPGFGSLPITIVSEQYDYYKSGTSDFPLFTHSSISVLSAIMNIDIGVVLSSENPSGYVGIEDVMLAEKEFGVYPNPTSGVFTASLPTVDANSSIVVLDAIGKVVKTIVPTSSTTEINLANEPKGVYFVKMNNSNDNRTIKLIVR